MSSNLSYFNYFSTPRFLNHAFNLTTCLQIPIHILGAYCILCKTPDSMKSVKWSMFNLHFWSVLLDLKITFLISPFVLFPAFAGFPLGVLKYTGISIDVQTYLILISYSALGSSILTLFENRYFLMFAKHSSWRNYRHPFLIINYIISSVYAMPAFLTIPDQKQAVAKVLNTLPNVSKEIRNAPIFVLATDFRLLVITVSLVAVLLVGESLFFVKLLFFNMRKRTRRMATSQYTLNLQRKFLRAIYIQVSAPFLLLSAPVAYLFTTIYFNFYHQVANNFCSLLLAVHGSSSSIFLILIHKSYRKVVWDLLKFDIFTRKNNQVSSFVVSRNSVAIDRRKKIENDSSWKRLISVFNRTIRV
ncbi:Serpentine Receptor, class H [Caenorhabditis elegans]|uniref:Serpentine Receptor, class H n=1 Tax=Caenorhabditis elegans TaxID=6239 RepID=O45162_CAEEL|nr:Serpentine Receptor, class H [Caenorhabditis elegans]CCD66317.1 Serpentine Receptor, class H [Caenorhabditis elegans]|eukprot:NP_503775.2 Serpentine Receptor, class H [Caenorhabditis elegans]